MSRPTALLLALLAAISGSACHGIGRPLVDKKKLAHTKGQTGLCVLAPSCNDDRLDDIASQIELINLAPVDFPSCSGSLRACTMDVDTLGTVHSDRCVAAFTPTEAPGGINGVSFDCAGWSISITDKHPDPVMLDAPELRHTQVLIETVAPAFVQLDNALLDDVRFTLHGPVTLRISHTRTFKSVRIVGSTTDDQNEPRIELQSVDGDDINISGESSPFQGTIALEEGTLTDTRIEAKTVDLTSIALAMSSIRAGTLDTSNATLSLATLAFDDGRLASSDISQTEITECKSLAIITGMLSHMRIANCDDTIRVYGANIELAFMDGQIQGDHATFQNVLFGAHSPTDLVAWDTQIFTSNFCSFSRTTRLGASVFVLCPSCDPDDRFIVCADSQAARKIETSQCDAFKDPDDCGLALPERPKPPR